jgi:hypothetical protein
MAGPAQPQSPQVSKHFGTFHAEPAYLIARGRHESLPRKPVKQCVGSGGYYRGAGRVSDRANGGSRRNPRRCARCRQNCAEPDLTNCRVRSLRSSVCARPESYNGVGLASRVTAETKTFFREPQTVPEHSL